MTSLVNCAIQAAKKAEQVLSGYFLKRTQAKRIGVEFKAEADKAADSAIYNIIKKKFPTHSILTEERARKEKFAEYTWVIDPIDGTTNFICGFPIWAISVCLVVNNQPTVAVANIPQLNKLYVAIKGKSTRCNNKTVKVDNITNLKRTVIALDPGYHPQRRQVIINTIKKLGENVSNLAIINSVGATFPLIASSNLQGLIHHLVKIWELPGALILQEAGGKITDFQGKKIKFNLTGQQEFSLVASNGKIHHKLIRLLNA